MQVRLCSGPKGVLLARNVQSEAIKALGHPALSDSFVSFAKTVMGLGVHKVKDGEDLRLSFNGTSYKALSLGTLFPSPGLEAALQHLELEFGREVVNNEYSKLSKLIAVTKQSTLQSPDSMSTSTLADKEEPLDVLGMEEEAEEDEGEEEGEGEAGDMKDYFSELDDQLENILDGDLPDEAEGGEPRVDGKTGMPLSSRHVKVHDSDALELDMHAMEHVLASFCSENQLEPGPASLLLGELGLGGSKSLDDMD
eukprot:symbB.v1.2.032667.t1/scaffold3953.1/size47576/1